MRCLSALIAFLALCAVATASTVELKWFNQAVATHWNDPSAMRNASGFITKLHEFRDTIVKDKLAQLAVVDANSTRFSEYQKQLIEGLDVAGRAFNRSSCEPVSFSPRESTPTGRIPLCLVKPRKPQNESEWDLMSYLAAKYAPIFHYHIDEANYPESVLSFIDHSEQKQHAKGSYYGLKSWVYRRGSPDFSDSRMYADYFIRDNVVNIKLYTFYPYTSKVYSGFKVKSQFVDIAIDRLMDLEPFGIHEGDFETVELHVDINTRELLGLTTWEVNPNGLPRKPLYHPTATLNVTGSHPNLWVALGSHNHYIKPGHYRLFAGFTRCFDNDKTPLYVGADLNDRAWGNGRVWHSTNAIRSIYDPRRNTPAWASFPGFFGDMDSITAVAVGCREGGQHQLATKLSERLAKSVDFVPAATRNTFAAGYVRWMCDSLSSTMFAWLDDPLGVPTPTHEKMVQKALVYQMKQCESLETYTADREDAFAKAKALFDISEYNAKLAEQARVVLAERKSHVLAAEKNYTDSVLAARAAAKVLDERRDAVVSQEASLVTAKEIQADLDSTARTEAERQIAENYRFELKAEEERNLVLRSAVREAKEAFHKAVALVKEYFAVLEVAQRSLAETRILRATRKAAALKALTEYEAANNVYEIALAKEQGKIVKQHEDDIATAKAIADANERKLSENKAAAEKDAAEARLRAEAELAAKLALQAKEFASKLAREEAEFRLAIEEAAARKKSEEAEAQRLREEQTAILEARRLEAVRLKFAAEAEEKARIEAEAAAAKAAAIAAAEGKAAQKAIEEAQKAADAAKKAAEAKAKAEALLAAAATEQARRDAQRLIDQANADKIKADEEEKRLLDIKRKAEAAAAEAARKAEADRIAAEEAKRKAEQEALAKKKADEEAAKAAADKAAADKAAEEAARKAKEAAEEQARIDATIEAERKAKEEKLKAEQEAARKKAEEDAAREKIRLEEEASLEAKKEAERQAAAKKEAEEAEARAKAEAERVKAEAERMAAEKAARDKAEADAKAAQAAKEAAELAAKLAREAEEAKRAEEAKLLAEKAAAEAEKKRAEEEQRMKDEAAKKAAQEAADALERAKREEDEKIRLEAERVAQAAKEAAEAQVRAAQEAAEAAAKAKAEEEARRLAAEEATKAQERAKAEAEAAAKKAEEERIAKEKADLEAELAIKRAQAEAKRKEEEANAAAERERKAAQEAAALKAKEEAEAAEKARLEKLAADKAAAEKALKEAEEQRKAAEEAVAKKKAEEEELERKKLEEAQRLANEELQKKLMEQEAQRKAEAEAKAKADAEAEAKKKAEEEEAAKKKAEEDRIAAENKAAQEAADRAEAARKKAEQEAEAAKKAEEAIAAAKKKAAEEAEAAKKRAEEEAIIKKKRDDDEAAARRKAAEEAAAAEAKRRADEIEAARKKAEAANGGPPQVNEKGEVVTPNRYAKIEGRLRDPVPPRWAEVDSHAEFKIQDD